MTKTLIVIGGPTASGKTDLAIRLAQHFHTEILSADSRQCYRELNIGVAKPSEHELALVKHHFINSHSIHDEVSAGSFETYALECLASIFKQKDIAIAVGGTGLYLKALCEGIDPMPSTNPEIEKDIEKQVEEKGLVWLKNELQAKDPLSFSKIDTSNPRRVLRALIFFESVGQSITQYQMGIQKQRPFAIRKIAIDMNRQDLYGKINNRVDMMMQEGLLQEVENLIPYQHLKSLQTVGYTELFTHLNGKDTLDHAVEKIKQHSRNYAKRQLTWFRNQSDYTWIQAANPIETLLNDLNS